MIEDNYPKAYKEIHEILKYVPEEELEKIPKNLIDIINKNMDVSYDFKIEKNQAFEEVPLLRETKSILAVIYKDYWANEVERARIIQKQQYDINLAEEEKQKQYNYEDLFKKNELSTERSKDIIIYEEKKWYIKFIKFIKSFFNRKQKN